MENSVPNWEVESLRFTGFLKTPQNIKEMESWWSAFTGVEPTQKQYMNNINLVEFGEWKQGGLQLAIAPFRFDFFYGPVQKQAVVGVGTPIPNDPINKGYVSLGLYNEISNDFFEAVKNWLKNAPVLNRLALGCICLNPVSDKVSGYQELGRLLTKSVQVDPVNSRDFFYSRNRPKPSTAFSEIMINRLSKWNVIGLKMQQFAVIGQKVVNVNANPSEEKNLVRLELDLNTDETHSDFTKEQSGKVFDDFVLFAKEIMKEGDV